MTGWRPLGGALALVLTLCVVAACGSDDSGGSDEKQTVRFQKPTERGPDPFTAKPTDIAGPDKVQVGSGPYGGTGSDLVCDRELLIRSLRARPDRMEAWAKVVEVEPTQAAVAKYIRKLKPVTLTRDTRVTNHSFVGGKASGYQAIMQAGTAVLVDEEGIPRTRCRCGNPLLEPVFIPEATCYGCPPNYHPPPECEPWDECYEVYKNPPPVKGGTATTGTQTAPPPSGGQLNPQASFSPSSAGPTDPFTLSLSGFTPNSTVTVTVTRPDGGRDPARSVSTDGSGSGSLYFPPPSGSNNPGTYTATVRDPTGATATASATVVSGGGGGGGSRETTTEDSPEQTTTDEPPPDDGSGDVYP